MNENSESKMLTIKIGAAKHANDWLGRYSGDEPDELWPEAIAHTERTVTIRLTEEALSDLISDAIYYSDEMGPEATGDGMDYRPPARSCLAALKRAGVEWAAKGFMTTITKVPS